MIKKSTLNTALLSICTVLLAVSTVGIYSRPTLEEIDQKMMMWGQHYGMHFSEINKQSVEKVVTKSTESETSETE